MADVIFGFCLLLGGSLLLLTLIVDDVFGGILGALHLGFDIAGVSPAPMLLGFIAMFGIGGLLAHHAMGLGSGLSGVVGIGFGLVGAGITFGAFKVLKQAESSDTFSLQDMVGQTARVSVQIPANHFGQVLITFAGTTHNLTATAGTDIGPGKEVKVVGVAGTNLVVESK